MENMETKYTTLSQGRIKVLVAHDGNYNNPAIDRCQALEILDDNGNVVKTMNLSFVTMEFE